MRNAAWMPSRQPAAARRELAVTAASAAIAAGLALANATATMERLIETVPPEIVDGVARGWLLSGLTP